MTIEKTTHIHWLNGHLNTQRLRVYCCVLIGILMGLLNIGQAYLIAALLSQLVMGHYQFNLYETQLWQLLGIVCAKSILTWLQHYCRFMIGQTLKIQIRNDLGARLTQVGPVPLKDFSTGDLSTTFHEKIEALHPYLSHYYPQSLLCMIIPLMILIVVFPLNWIAALILLITAPLIPLMMALIGKKAAHISQEQMATLSKMGAHFLDCLQGLGTLKLYQQAEPEIQNIQKTAEAFRKSTMKVLAIAFLSSTVLEFFSAAALALLAAFLGFTLLGELNLGPHLSFQTALFILLLAPDFYQPLRELAKAYHAKADALAAAKAIQALYALTLCIPNEPEQVASKNNSFVFSSPPSITLECVCYQYPNRQQQALKQISVHIQAGEHFAFTGPSGSGKSTLMDCLLRFIQPTQGSIKVNNIPINEIPMSLWQSQVAWIGQKTDLFPGTLRDNLLIANPSASPEACWQALVNAQAESFVQSLPLGLDNTIAEQHLGLSGGQARRIAIARAFLKNSPILLMDEPTASLDEATAHELLLALQSLRHQKTVITISHRLETLKHADRIGILKAGQLIAVGHFKELLRQGLLTPSEDDHA